MSGVPDEIHHYRSISQRHGLDISYVDVSDAHSVCPKDQDSMLQRLHVLSGDDMRVGIDGFLVLWQRLPGYRVLASIVGWPPLRTLSAMLYDRVLAPAIYAWHQRRTRALAT